MRPKVPAAVLATLCLLAAVPAGSVAVGSTAVGSTAVGPHSGEAVSAEQEVATTQDDPPPDPESDRLGWENGVWYNESIDVDASDGIDREESARLLDRTMARVELVRGVEFDEPVDLNFRNRSEVAQLFAPGESAIPETAVNVQLEALGFAGEDRNGVDVFLESRRGSAAAFVVSRRVPQLDLEAGDITIVMDEGQTAYSEVVLAHELVHVIQVQELEVSTPSTGLSTDSINANRAVTEGEASYVGYRYQQRCGNEWDCVTPQTPVPNRSAAAAGLVYTNLVGYSHGAELVAERYETGGWDAVVDLYALPPTSSEQAIHPEKYREDEPQRVAVSDRSGEDWRPLTSQADTLGESGLFVLLWYPSFESGSEVVVAPSRFDESIRSQIQFNFDHEASAGWDGDRLVPYVSGEAGENETGYVWHTVWDSERDATEFREAYLTVLDYRGAQPVGEDDQTFRIPDGTSFGDAFSVVQNGSEVRIVNAPTVAELSAVHEGAGPETLPTTPTPVSRATPTATATPTPTATVTPTATATPTATVAPTPTDTATPTSTVAPTPTSTTASTATPTSTTDARETGAPATTDGTGPGFGHFAVLVALGAFLVVTRRRE